MSHRLVDPGGCRLATAAASASMLLLWAHYVLAPASTTPCSDAEFYGLFDNQQAAINYVTMLVGCE